MSVSIAVAFEGIEGAEAALGRLDPLQPGELLDRLGRMIQEQTRRRIIQEKTAPDGKAWKPNLTRTSILLRSGTLARSIDYAVAGEAAIVGSGLVYAGIHQHGGTIRAKNKKALMFRVGNQFVTRKSVTIPARPYLGISSENAEDILDATKVFLRKRLGGG